MNKKLLIALLYTIPLIAYAEDWIKMVPINKQGYSDEMNRIALKMDNDIATKGYYETTDNKTAFLFDMKRNGERYIKENIHGKYKELDTGLKTNYTDIKLAFNFKELKAISKKDIIGYGATGSYIKQQKLEGWNGITLLFNYNESVCSYTCMPVIEVTLNPKADERAVNNKHSTSMVEGNINDGFLYNVEWFSNKTSLTIECAKKVFDKNFLKEMIVLAKKIDRNE